MMRKIIICLVLSLLVMSSVFSQGETEMKKDGESPEVTINVATIFADGTAIVKGLERMAAILDEESGGKISFKFFTSGVTGGEREQVEALQLGEIEMSAFGTLPISILTPKYSFFDSPFVFRDKDHFMGVWNSYLGDAMREAMEENGLKTIGVMGRGYRHITSNVPVYSINDIKKLKIRTPESALFMETFGKLGAVTVPIALPELFTSLQMGVVNASEGPLDQIVTNKLYEVQQYITISSYYYSISMWQINADFFNGLPAEYQSMILKAAEEATAYATKLGEDMEAGLKKQCEDAGVTFTQMGDLTPYLNAIKPVMDRFYAERWPVTSSEEIASY